MILDFNNAKSSEMGRVAIQFREDDEKNPSNINAWYALNSHNDSWFRVKNKFLLSDGFGLKVKAIFPASPKNYAWGYGSAIKAKMVFEDNANKTRTENIWLYIESGCSFEDVVKHIENCAYSWVD